jgi:hypothetical protein
VAIVLLEACNVREREVRTCIYGEQISSPNAVYEKIIIFLRFSVTKAERGSYILFGIVDYFVCTEV